MNLTIAEALRYGLRTKDEVAPFVVQFGKKQNALWRRDDYGEALDKLKADTTAVLADFYGDVGDPREHILRRSLNPTVEPPFDSVTEPPHSEHNPFDIPKSVVVSSPFKQGGGSLGINLYRKEGQPIIVARLEHLAPDKNSTERRYFYHSVESYHTPEEFRQILDGLEEHLAFPEKLRSVIDRHFGKQ